MGAGMVMGMGVHCQALRRPAGLGRFGWLMHGQYMGPRVCSQGIVVPEPIRANELCSHNVLVTRWIDGERLSDSRAADVRALCNTLLSAYLVALLDTGFLHADPHPGEDCVCLGWMDRWKPMCGGICQVQPCNSVSSVHGGCPCAGIELTRAPGLFFLPQFTPSPPLRQAI